MAHSLAGETPEHPVKNAQTELQAMVTLTRKCGPARRQLARDRERSLRPGEIRRASQRRQNWSGEIWRSGQPLPPPSPCKPVFTVLWLSPSLIFLFLEPWALSFHCHPANSSPFFPATYPDHSHFPWNSLSPLPPDCPAGPSGCSHGPVLCPLGELCRG